ncbi:uncharacterized protein LOC121195881 isoform X2 [Toxotes jaculatrix]|uniref:uncharacterized protein LOC121195881 isoform X2 n=1 Tax=Toxotes jaculatrix TaxID=941984 RepID=UPI001B3B103C|nr:uncharacterized protein LOC121195881 isoform X2 [Toxotes jaculatrix]
MDHKSSEPSLLSALPASSASQSCLKPITQRPNPDLIRPDPSSPCGPGNSATMFSNVSSKYKDIMSKSALIRSGCPALYQLRPKKQMFGTLSRMTVGEKRQNNENKTVLLVGETGTGKSTLINALINYTMGVKFEDNVWFQIVEDVKKSQTESQTSDVIVYEIFGFEGQTLPYSLTIIDTPGYGDTAGTEKDDLVSQRLFDLFRSEDGVHEIHAVGLVVKATENRLSDRLMYIFNSVMSLFEKNVKNNIVALITHSDGTEPENVLQALEAAKIKCATDEKNQPGHFLFNNQQSKDRLKGRKFLEQADEISVRGMREFISFLETSQPQTLEKTVQVLNEHVRLTACIQNLEERIRLIKLKQTEIRQTKEALKTHEEEMKTNKDFTIEVDEVYKEKQEISGGMWGLFYEAAVTCNRCEETCHYPGCTVAWYPNACEVMSGGCCTVCSNHCHHSNHVKEKWIYVNKTRKVQKTIYQIKEKYEKNKSEKEEKKSLLENLEQEMKTLTAKKDQFLEESYQHLLSLEKIALNVNSLSTHVHLDILIEKMEERGDREKVQKLEEMKSRGDKGIQAGLRYKYRKQTSGGKDMKPR